MFATLNLNTTSGKTYKLESGSTQTVSGAISLTGDSALTRLVLRATTTGSEASFNVTGTQNIAFVNVKDNHAVGDTMTAGAESVDGGNTDGWFIGAVIPALPWVGLVALGSSWPGPGGSRGGRRCGRRRPLRLTNWTVSRVAQVADGR